GLMFGLLPAWQISRADPGRALQETGRSAVGRRGNWLRGVFVIAEVSLALVLVAGAGLLIRSFLLLQQADMGFQGRQVATFQLSLPASKYKRDASPAYFQELVRRIESVPGVLGAGVVNYLPLTGNVFGWGYRVEGQPRQPGTPEPVAQFRSVSPGFFQALAV